VVLVQVIVMASLCGAHHLLHLLISDMHNDGSLPETVGDDESMRNKSPPPSPDNDVSHVEAFSSIRIEGWACTKCTLQNEASNTTCILCGSHLSRKTTFEAVDPFSGGLVSGGSDQEGPQLRTTKCILLHC
jgi:hypothetical protein